MQICHYSVLFRQNIWLKYSAEYYAETAFGRSLTIREGNYLVLCVSVLLLEPVVPLHVHELRLPPEELVLLVHQVEQLHYQVLGLRFRKHLVYETQVLRKHFSDVAHRNNYTEGPNWSRKTVF